MKRSHPSQRKLDRLITIIIARSSVPHQGRSCLFLVHFLNCPPTNSNKAKMLLKRAVPMVLKRCYRRLLRRPQVLQRTTNLLHHPLLQDHLSRLLLSLSHHNNNHLVAPRDLREWDSLRSYLLGGLVFHQSPLYLNTYSTNQHRYLLDHPLRPPPQAMRRHPPPYLPSSTATPPLHYLRLSTQGEGPVSQPWKEETLAPHPHPHPLPSWEEAAAALAVTRER